MLQLVRSAILPVQAFPSMIDGLCKQLFIKTIKHIAMRSITLNTRMISILISVVFAFFSDAFYMKAHAGTSAHKLQSMHSLSPAQARRLIINGARLSDQQVLDLERRFKVKLPDGDFWYDSYCGAWGRTGGPCLGLTLPGLKVGGQLKANASNGNTGVFVNGRELHTVDVLLLRLITPVVYRGRWWVNANGDYSDETGLLRGSLKQTSYGGNQESQSVYSKFGTLHGNLFQGAQIGGNDDNYNP